MTSLEVIREQYIRAVQRLEEVLQIEKTPVSRDSAIKRFELCFDLSWKLVKVLLEDRFGLIVRSPKSAYREAFRQGLIEYKEQWLQMTDDRNEAVHTYLEALAEKIFDRLDEYLELFRSLQETEQS